MDLGQSPRPRALAKEFKDREPRTKCTICCAARSSAFTGGTVLAITVPCNLVLLSGRLCDSGGWRGFANRHLFLALPFAAVTFTHHLLLSESLWSKNKKTVLEINIQSSLSNITLWCLGTGLATYVSRRVLPQRSREYRLLLWNYTRTRRSCANKYFPTAFGRITEDLDWYNMLWVVSLYHILWGMASVFLEKESGAQYAMFFRDSNYSRWCSPRWREWREIQMINCVQTEQVIAPSRWGTFLTNDKWKSRVD